MSVTAKYIFYKVVKGIPKERNIMILHNYQTIKRLPLGACREIRLEI
jgi:hypothetical protein